VDPTYLKTLGIHHQSFPNTSDLTGINALAKERDYKNRDEIEISPTKLPNYEEKVKNFFHEHLHEDEEIRYILDGAGYFDVRSEGDDWVRIRLEKGDLMIMPAGIYHRFTTDEKDVSFLFSRHGTLCRMWKSFAQGNDEIDADAFDSRYSTPRRCAFSRRTRNGLLFSVARRRTRTLIARSTLTLSLLASRLPPHKKPFFATRLP
jgi:1,2-dihydroxy-3-keto-5-methylthiopentene dioxygenase